MTLHRSARARSRAARAVLATACAAAGLGVSVAPASAAPALPAFPGAEGFGAGATGGRGGDVAIVDTLEPFGPGSLGEALDPGDCRPRTIVFRVSGVIEVPGKHDLELTCGNVTIAGQTAPGAGITIHGRIDGYEAGGNIIVRHLRLRPPPITDAEGAVDDLGSIYDALQLSGNPRLILDHLSLSWGSDETLDLFEGTTDATVQWTTVEQSNPHGQPEGPHNDGMIAGPDSPRVSVHHVLFAHHDARCPALSAGPAELVNSTTYDCEDGFVHHNPAAGEFHLVGNTFLQGPSQQHFTPIYLDDEEPGGTTYYVAQNQFTAPDQFEGVADGIPGPLAEEAFAGADADQLITAPTDFATTSESYVPITRQAPAAAHDAVLAQAGAFPRDAMTRETVDDVRNGTGDWQPDPPADLLTGLTPGAAPADEDRDGIADSWEASHGLDAANAADQKTVLPTGYTALETYVNELSDQLVGQPAPAGDPPVGGGAEQGTTAPEGATPTTARPAAPASPNGNASAAPATTPVAATTEPDRVPVLLAGLALAVACAALALAFAAHRLARRTARAH